MIPLLIQIQALLLICMECAMLNDQYDKLFIHLNVLISEENEWPKYQQSMQHVLETASYRHNPIKILRQLD
jgi:hypothetical protein